jgi:hypothetical protein
MRRSVAVVLLAVAAALPAGCGGSGDDAKRELRQTAQRLGEIRSGDLDLRLFVLPVGGTQGRIGFELSGPFALRRNALPTARIRYTQFAGTREATATFVSDGRRAVAVANGKTITLPPSAVEQLRGATAGLGGPGGVGGLRIDSWLKDPSVSDGGELGGAHTDHISAKLDVVNAANGLLTLVRQLGRDTPALTGKSADQLRNAVKSSSIDVWTGRRDRLLRRLELKARLGFDVPEELTRALDDVVGATFEFVLAIAHPNEPVHVSLGGGS